MNLFLKWRLTNKMLLISDMKIELTWHQTVEAVGYKVLPNKKIY